MYSTIINKSLTPSDNKIYRFIKRTRVEFNLKFSQKLDTFPVYLNSHCASVKQNGRAALQGSQNQTRLKAPFALIFCIRTISVSHGKSITRKRTHLAYM